MTIPASPPVSLSDLASEYGDSLPYSLSNFLGKTDAPSAFPASMSDWYGLSDINTTLNNWTQNTSAASASTVFGFDASGQTLRQEFTGGTGPDDGAVWLTGDVQANWHVRAVLNSGALTGGDVTGSWLALTSGRSWQVAESTPGQSETANLTIQVSDDGGSTIIDSCTVDITATSPI